MPIRPTGSAGAEPSAAVVLQRGVTFTTRFNVDPDNDTRLTTPQLRGARYTFPDNEGDSYVVHSIEVGSYSGANTQVQIFLDGSSAQLDERSFTVVQGQQLYQNELVDFSGTQTEVIFPDVAARFQPTVGDDDDVQVTIGPRFASRTRLLLDQDIVIASANTFADSGMDIPLTSVHEWLLVAAGRSGSGRVPAYARVNVGGLRSVAAASVGSSVNLNNAVPAPGAHRTGARGVTNLFLSRTSAYRMLATTQDSGGRDLQPLRVFGVKR